VKTPGKLIQPNSRIGTISADADGLIWVFILVAAPNSKEAMSGVAPKSGEGALNEIDWEKVYHTRIEVIDPKTNRVVVRNRLREFVIAAFPDRKVAIYQADEAGTPRISIAQLTIRR
jgi:hypothetical protein